MEKENQRKKFTLGSIKCTLRDRETKQDHFNDP